MIPAHGRIGHDDGIAHLPPKRDDSGWKLEALTGLGSGLGKKEWVHLRVKGTGRILMSMRARRGSVTRVALALASVLSRLSPRISKRAGAPAYCVALCLMIGAAGRFGFRANLGQCPTAPVQSVTVVTQDSDGTVESEIRAPQPGEKDFVVCHCQAKRAAATQTGWFVPTSAPSVMASAGNIDMPVRIHGWVQPAFRATSCDPPADLILHPPCV
jgi:hypothetical protein